MKLDLKFGAKYNLQNKMTCCSFRKSAAYRVVAPSSGRGKGHAGQNNVILVISCQTRKPSASGVELALTSVVAQAIYLAAVELENEQMQLISFQSATCFNFTPVKFARCGSSSVTPHPPAQNPLGSSSSKQPPSMSLGE